jgi:hypothetical protein
MCGGDEVVVLSPDLSAAPMRVFPPLNTLPSALRTQDGGAWMFSVGFLARYDATGRQLRLVDEFAQASPAEFTISGANYGVDWPQMALAPSDEPILIVGEKGLIKIWHLDDQGQVLLRAGFGDAKTYPVVDRSGRAVLLTMTLGDLSVRRVELEPEAKIVSQHTAMRDDYTDLVIDNVTEDLAGNLYVLTGTGPRGASVATVCKLPLKGDLSCYLLPAMHGRMIVGGDKNVLYAATRTTNDVAETLQRYDLP